MTLVKSILTNILTALYHPFWFAVILSVFILFFYLYAYKPDNAGKGMKQVYALFINPNDLEMERYKKILKALK